MRLERVILKERQLLNGSKSPIRDIHVNEYHRINACEVKGMGNVIVVDVASAFGIKTTYIFAANIASAW